MKKAYVWWGNSKNFAYVNEPGKELKVTYGYQQVWTDVFGYAVDLAEFLQRMHKEGVEIEYKKPMPLVKVER